MQGYYVGYRLGYEVGQQLQDQVNEFWEGFHYELFHPRHLLCTMMKYEFEIEPTVGQINGLIKRFEQIAPEHKEFRLTFSDFRVSKETLTLALTTGGTQHFYDLTYAIRTQFFHEDLLFKAEIEQIASPYINVGIMAPSFRKREPRPMHLTEPLRLTVNNFALYASSDGETLLNLYDFPLPKVSKAA